MDTFQTTAKVEAAGEIRVPGVPFSAGTEVDVIVSPKRTSAEDFRSVWEQVCEQLRSLPQLATVTEQEVEAEIAAHRARG